MESSSIVKIGAAFVAGVVVALGGALIVAHVTDNQHPVPVAQISSASSAPAELPDAGGDVATQQPLPAPADVRPEAKPSAPTHVKVPIPTRAVVERRRPHLALAVAKSTAHPVVIAQAEPAALPQTPASAAVSNDPPPEQVTSPVTHDPQPDPKDTMSTPAPAVPAATPQPHVVTLPAGTVLSVRLGETLSTDHNYSGDTFRATLLSPVIMEGFIIADRGSKVLGKITDAQASGHLGNVAGLSLALTEINTTDGQRVRVETNVYERHGPSSTGQDVAKIGGGAVLGAIIGGAAGGGKGAAIGAGAGGAAGTGAVLLTHGKPAVIQNETQMTFRLANPVTITERLN